MRYKIIIEESVSQTFIILADSAEEARRLGEKMYNKGEIVLDNANITGRNMCVCVDSDIVSDWQEF